MNGYVIDLSEWTYEPIGHECMNCGQKTRDEDECDHCGADPFKEEQA